MTTNSLQAFILHKQWSGDTSAKVTFFSREAGLLDCLCKGVKTSKKYSLLQAFTPMWICVNEKYQSFYLQNIEHIAPSFYLEGHALFSGLYVNELLYHVLRAGSSEPELFDAYLGTLEGLVTSIDNSTLEACLRRFEWSLLKACGQTFSFTEEAHTARPVQITRNYQFIPGDGFVSMTKGIPGAHLLALSADQLNTTDYLKTAKFIMRQAISHLLGGKALKTRDLFPV